MQPAALGSSNVVLYKKCLIVGQHIYFLNCKYFRLQV